MNPATAPAPVPSGAPSKYAQKQRARKIRPWHEHIIDDLLAFPKSSLAERSARLKYKPSYLGLLMNSDMFKAIYAARRAQYQTALNDAIIQKAYGVAGSALDVMKEQIETKRSAIPFPQLVEGTNAILERLGFGVPQAAGGQGVTVNVQQNGAPQLVAPVASAEQLAEARARLRGVEAQNAATAALVATPSPSAAPVSYMPEPGDGDIIEGEIIEGPEAKGGA